MVAHSALTGSNLHEPKGVAAASAGYVYVANGSGSGTWKKVTTSEVNTASIFNLNKSYLTCDFVDVSTAEDIYLVIPYAGTLVKVWTVLQGVITGADSVITVRDNGGNSAGTITVAYTGSAAGDVDSLTPESNNTFTAGQKLKLSNDGGSTGAARLFVTLEFTVTG